MVQGRSPLRAMVLVLATLVGSLAVGACAAEDGTMPIGGPPGDCEDEGCACAADGVELVCGTDVGACTTGVRVCRDGALGACEAAIDPTEELCNGKDDDCDGTPDQGCPCSTGETRACGDAAGECAEGTQTCELGTWGACGGAVTPTAETCDGLDNDCDGSVDEGGNGCGGVCPLAMAPGTTCDGADADVCTDDVAACAGPNDVACSTGADDRETFDRTDQDCDGIVDDGFSVLSFHHDDYSGASGTCPTGYGLRGAFKFDRVPNTPPYLSASTWDGRALYGGWLDLCSPTDGVILVDGAGGCPTATLDRGSFQVDSTYPTLTSGATSTGASINGGQWLRLCSRTGVEQLIVSVDDHTGVTRSCPAGTTQRGRFKPDVVAAGASPSAHDAAGRTLRSGWLDYCAP